MNEQKTPTLEEMLSDPKWGRIAIAEDILKWLRPDHPEQGTYLDSPFLFHATPERAKEKAEVDEILKTCQVCAIGACFLSYLNLFDGMTNKQVEMASHKDMFEILEKFFDRKQLNLIEAAFERFSDSPKVKAFYDRHSNPYNRLRAIFQNIIDNDGTFIP